jgi:hypothetical protein
MRRPLLPLLLLLAVACASANRPSTPGRPEIGVRQLGSLFFGSGSTSPITFEVGIRNVAAEPIKIVRVRLEASPSMAQYTTYPVERVFNETLAPGETKAVSLVATARTLTRNPTEPLSMRAFIDYESGGTRHRELYMFFNVGE